MNYKHTNLQNLLFYETFVKRTQKFFLVFVIDAYHISTSSQVGIDVFSVNDTSDSSESWESECANQLH